MSCCCCCSVLPLLLNARVAAESHMPHSELPGRSEQSQTRRDPARLLLLSLLTLAGSNSFAGVHQMTAFHVTS